MLKCYYAHPMPLYNSLIEIEDVVNLRNLSLEVVNPNSPEIQKRFTDWKKYNPTSNVMEFFGLEVQKCNFLFFRGLPDSKIPSGVAYEINVALENNIPVFELPSNMEKRFMSYPETKKYFFESGFYK